MDSRASVRFILGNSETLNLKLKITTRRKLQVVIFKM